VSSFFLDLQSKKGEKMKKLLTIIGTVSISAATATTVVACGSLDELKITMAFAGTLIGTFIAIPVAIMASTNIVRNKFLNNFARVILAVFRTIPAFVYALLLVNYFGQTTFTVTLALTIFTFLISGKTLYERIEQVNTQMYTAARATGATKNRSLRAAV
jgi:phosphonate transport system permease protein